MYGRSFRLYLVIERCNKIGIELTLHTCLSDSLHCITYTSKHSLILFRCFLPHFLFLLLSGYYLLMPGSIAEPRYQLPALPFICLAAAFGLVYFRGIIKEKKGPSGL